MKITAKITKVFTNQAGRIRAFATVCLAEEFLVTGVRIIACDKGLTVFMPNAKDKNGNYQDVCFPITQECRYRVNKIVLQAYENYLAEMESSNE